eukprot:2928616-Pleurochrysis_carterae.AAC.1
MCIKCEGGLWQRGSWGPMAADTGRDGVVHGSGRGGIIAVGAGVHACSSVRNGCSIVIIVVIEHHH